jgi:filamentous hemagglutinin family protein
VAHAHAQIATDGSVGPAVDLAGPDYVIPADLGLQSGGNLFHSFDTFGVASGESATFTDTGAVAPIDRVLSRVTGGSASEIDGLLRSEIAGADLYLLNPSGVIFGPGAELDVQGSFHVSTADELRFPNGERFEARAGGEVPLLAVAEPEAFGFLSGAPASIELDGSFLAVPEGESISLLGGDLTLRAARNLQADTGRIDLVAVGSAGTVTPGTGAEAPRLEGFSALGEISLTDGSISTAGPAGGGRIFLRGGDIVLKDVDVFSDRFGDIGSGGSVDVEAWGLLQLTDTRVSAGTSGSAVGDAGTIDVRARELRIDREDRGRSGFDVRSFSLGRAGTIRVEAERIDIGPRGGGVHALDASIYGAGPGAGEITVRAGVLEMRDHTIGAVSGRFATGAAGHIDIQADEIRLDGSARLDASSVRAAGQEGRGNGGSIDVVAGDFVLGTGSPGLSVTTQGSGKAGEIRIVANSLEMGNGSFLSAVAHGGSTGDAGSIVVDADHIAIAGTGAFAGMDAATFGSGRGGEIRVSADTLDVHSGFIGADAGGGSTGPAGSVTVVAREVTLDAQHADTRIAARTFGEGRAGSIRVEAERLQMGGGPFFAGLDAATIGTGAGGDITVVANEFRLGPNTFVGVASLTPSASAGSIRIEAGRFEMDGTGGIGTLVDARSFGAGRAGSIQVVADTVDMRAAGMDAANLVEGEGGDLHVEARDVKLDQASFMSVFALSPPSEAEAGSLRVTAGRFDLRDSWLDARSLGEGRIGSIEIDADELRLERSFLDATGTGLPGEIRIAARKVDLEGSEITTRSFGSHDAGDIGITGGEILLVDSLVRSTTLEGGDAGSISIVGDRITLLDGGEVQARTRNGGDAGDVVLRATRSIEIAGRDATGDQSDVQTTVIGLGDAGTIELSAPDILLDDHALVTSSHVPGTGVPGEVRIAAERLEIRGGALVSTSSLGGGTGAISIEASESVRISNEGGVPLSRDRLITENAPGPAGVFSATVEGDGESGLVSIRSPLVQIMDGGIVATTTLDQADAGQVAIEADRVEITNGGLVDSSSAGSGAAGKVSIQAAESILLTGVDERGVPSRVRSAATASGAGGDVELSAPEIRIEGGAIATTTVGEGTTGRGGAIDLDAGRLLLSDGGRIDSGTFSLADGGSIALEARQSLEIRGEGSGVFAETGGPGVGGAVEISAGAARIENGGLVSSRSGSGLAAAELVFRDAVEGSFIPPLRAPPTDIPGDAGSVKLAASSLTLIGGAIDTAAEVGDGGNIELQVTGLVTLQDASLTASVGSGSGGNIAIDPPAVVLDRSRIVAQADQGAGGSIAIRTDVLIASPDSLISASSNLGIDGTVEINAPDVDLAGSLVALPETPLDAAGLLRERCAAQRSDDLGSFVVRGREAVPASHAEGLMLTLVPPVAVSVTTPHATVGSGGNDLILAAALPLEPSCPTLAAFSD